MTKENPCPCSSGETYEKCCARFHQGELPESALQLMCSRYSAYALDLPDYIVETTHPASSQYSENTFSWKRNISQFSRSSTFSQLDVLDFKERGSIATVTFTAHILQKGYDGTFTEKSHFEKVHGRWFYIGGQLAEGHAPNLVTTGQLKVLPLAYYGDPILRRKADPVEISDDIRKLVEEMIETVEVYDGGGLAAPQVHHSIRLFIVCDPEGEERDKFEPGEIKVFINPTISSPSAETSRAPEGCLSIPTISAEVERPNAITIEYTDLEGNTHTERFSGWEARVIQHEYDHIEGVLYIDRIDESERAELEPFLSNLKNRIHRGKEI